VLRVDISAMAKGDLSHIGEKGTNLSGGQRARLALARSCFLQLCGLSSLSSLANIMIIYLQGFVPQFGCMTSLARLTPKLLRGSWKRLLWGTN